MRLIDADELKRGLCAECTLSDKCLKDDCDYASIYHIDHAPTIEPKHGRWIEDEYGIPHCSKCGTINNTVYKNYCPNCGAKMDLDEVENG